MVHRSSEQMFLYKIKQWGDQKLKNLDSSQSEPAGLQRQRSMSNEKGRRVSLLKLKPLTQRGIINKNPGKNINRKAVQYSIDNAQL